MQNPFFTPIGKLIIFSVIVFNVINYINTTSEQNDDLINKKRAVYLNQIEEQKERKKESIDFNKDLHKETIITHNENSLKVRQEYTSQIIKKWKKNKGMGKK